MYCIQEKHSHLSMYGRKVYHSVADPGFPPGGAPTLGGGGTPTYEFSKFSQKLLETRLHSSRMHTARLLTVSPSMHWAEGGVSLPGGSALPEGGLLAGGSALQGGGFPCQRGACLPGGVSAWQGGWYPSMH